MEADPRATSVAQNPQLEITEVAGATDLASTLL